MSNGGKALDVGIEQHRQRGCFSLAELRKLCGDRLDGAMVLAELGAGGDGVNGGGIPLSGKRTRDFTRIGGDGRIEPRTHALRELRGALASEFLNGLLATVLGKKT